MKKTFIRFERKFLLSELQKNLIIDKIKNYMVLDQYNVDSKPYIVSNIYFDNNNYEIIRHSLSKPSYKDKIRIRYYENYIKEEDLVFFEIKKKYNRKVTKRRISLPLSKIKSHINDADMLEMENYVDKQILNEINYTIKNFNLKPYMFIKYDRLAYFDENSDLRITFDSDIKYSEMQGSLNFNNELFSLLQPKTYLMEIKTEYNFPLWLANFLSELNIFNQSFSKYGKVYEKHVIGILD